MTPRQRRDRLFKTSKPTVRFIEEEDLKWLWAARRILDADEDIDQETFTDEMVERLSEFDAIYMLEDDNPQFSERFGPVGFIAAYTDGWTLQPHAQWMPWARRRTRRGGMRERAEPLPRLVRLRFHR